MLEAEPLPLVAGEARRMTDRLWSVADLARYLGVPVQTIYAWRHRGEGPPAHRVGRYLRYRSSDVERWLAERRDVSGVRDTVDAAP